MYTVVGSADTVLIRDPIRVSFIERFHCIHYSINPTLPQQQAEGATDLPCLSLASKLLQGVTKVISQNSLGYTHVRNILQHRDTQGSIMLAIPLTDMANSISCILVDTLITSQDVYSDVSNGTRSITYSYSTFDLQLT